MSSFKIKAKHKVTGEIVDVFCHDDYFGSHQYGYSVNGAECIDENNFAKRYERINSHKV